MLGMWVMLQPLPALCLLSGTPAASALPARFAQHPVYPRKEQEILNLKCRSNARFAFLLHCPLDLSCKSCSSLALPENQSVVAAGQEPKLGAQHEASGFSWQHTLPRNVPWHVPFTPTTWPSHQTLQHHSQGCSWPLVTQETDGKCRSRWLERAVSHEWPSPPLGPSSPSGCLRSCQLQRCRPAPVPACPSPGLGCCNPGAKRPVASLINSN